MTELREAVLEKRLAELQTKVNEKEDEIRKKEEYLITKAEELKTRLLKQEESQLRPKEIRLWIDENGSYQWLFGDKLTIFEMYLMGGILQDESMITMRAARQSIRGEKNVDETKDDMEHNSK